MVTWKRWMEGCQLCGLLMALLSPKLSLCHMVQPGRDPAQPPTGMLWGSCILLETRLKHAERWNLPSRFVCDLGRIVFFSFLQA